MDMWLVVRFENRKLSSEGVVQKLELLSSKHSFASDVSVMLYDKHKDTAVLRVP